MENKSFPRNQHDTRAAQSGVKRKRNETDDSPLSIPAAPVEDAKRLRQLAPHDPSPMHQGENMRFAQAMHGWPTGPGMQDYYHQAAPDVSRWMPYFPGMVQGSAPADRGLPATPGYPMMPPPGALYMPYGTPTGMYPGGMWYMPPDMGGMDPISMYGRPPSGTPGLYTPHLPAMLNNGYSYMQTAQQIATAPPPPVVTTEGEPQLQVVRRAGGSSPPSSSCSEGGESPTAQSDGTQQPKVRLPALPDHLKNARLIATATSAGLGLITMEDGTRVRGKMEINERRKVESFIELVKSAKKIVRMGDLAKELRDFVNPIRPVEFFEKLVSRRKLKVLLGPYMVRRWESTSAPPLPVHMDARRPWEHEAASDAGSTISSHVASARDPASVAEMSVSVQPVGAEAAPSIAPQTSQDAHANGASSSRSNEAPSCHSTSPPFEQ